MILPRLVYVTNDCTYPLHPSENYEGEAHARRRVGIPEHIRVIQVPRWMRYPPGEWHWCPRCTRRDVARGKLVQHLYEERAALPVTWGQLAIHSGIWQQPERWERLFDRPTCIKNQLLGGRFATHVGQTNFAKRHAPPGLVWCPWGLHYAPPRPGRNPRDGRATWCEPCYKRWTRCMKWRTFAQWMQDAQQAREGYKALQEQARSLRKEVAELRQLKLALLDEMARRPVRQPWEEDEEYSESASATLIVGPWEASQRPGAPAPVGAAHHARHATRRRAFSA